MSDLIPNEADSATGRISKRTRSLFRKAVKLMLRPGRRLFHYYDKDAAAKLEYLQSRLNRADCLAEALHKKADVLSIQYEGLSSHLEGLTQHHWALLTRFEALVVQYDGLLRLLPGIDNHFESLEEKLSAVHALHWDHIALARRLGAIEDVLAAGGDTAKQLIEDGRERPLLPFPGLDLCDLKKFRVS